MRSRATSQSQITSPAPVSASARRSESFISPSAMAPPAKACCITVKPSSSTRSTSPPASAGCTMSLTSRPETVSPVPASHAMNSSHVGISMIARS